MSLQDYLEFEASSDVRHEFVAGEIYAFAGGTERHNLVTLNIVSRLMSATENTGCRVLASDVQLQVAHDIIYYPDVMVVCDAGDSDPLIKRRPVFVAEVLSDSTRSYDLREKLMFYRQITSLRTYLIVEQDEPRIYRYWRDDEDLWWSRAMPAGATIPLPELETSLAIDDIYRNLPERSASSDAD